jgi:predicted O-methyltransferase YrrM
MIEERWGAVDHYISDQLIGEDRVADAALAASEAAGLPPIATSPNQGRLLELLVRVQRAQSILELGTLGAYSTIWMARALAPGGRLLTLEADPHCAEVALANIAAAGLEDVVELRVGPALENLPGLVAEGNTFDLIFVDADKPSYPQYLEWSLKLSRPGTLIIVDNVIGGGAIIDADGGDPWREDGGVRGVRRFYEMLGAESGVRATAIQTVGEKGHDGFVLALVSDAPGASAST